MIELRDAGMRGLGEIINIEPHYEVRVGSVRGKLPCPFGDPGIFPKCTSTSLVPTDSTRAKGRPFDWSRLRWSSCSTYNPPPSKTRQPSLAGLES
jgi:hypothetical protein